MDISEGHEQQTTPQQQPEMQEQLLQQHPHHQQQQLQLKQFSNHMQCDASGGDYLVTPQQLPAPAPTLAAMDTTATTTTALSVYKGPLEQQPPRPQLLPPPNTATDIDIDSLLLQQFSCMGTTDHEDLIQQFQCLMNNQMNKDSAQFFLEMSNWNLQTAIGCYLDFCNFQTPTMKIVEQTRPSEFQQVWRLQNDGTEMWPNGCYLMSPSQTRRIVVPTIRPGETCDIVAEIPATQPAVMWRLCTPNGWYFGETIWMIPPGTCSTQAELAARMSQLRTPTGELANQEGACPQVHVVISVNME